MQSLFLFCPTKADDVVVGCQLATVKTGDTTRTEHVDMEATRAHLSENRFVPDLPSGIWFKFNKISHVFLTNASPYLIETLSTSVINSIVRHASKECSWILGDHVRSYIFLALTGNKPEVYSHASEPETEEHQVHPSLDKVP